MQVKLEKCNATVMIAALNSLNLAPRLIGTAVHFGINEYIDAATGQARLNTNRDANEIKRAYSLAVVQQTTKRAGWTLQQAEPQQTEELTFQLQRR
jgi:hypothetical protein